MNGHWITAAISLNHLPIGWLIGGAITVLVALVLITRALNRRFYGTSAPVNPDNPQDTNRGCSIVFGGIFALAGMAALFFITIRPFYRSQQAGHWPTVPGVVISSQIGESHSDDGTTYRVDIRYRYAVNGQTLESNQYDSSGTNTYSGYRSRKQAIVHNHPPGKAVTVRYNPADPSDAMLTTELPAGTFSFIWFPLIFIAVGLSIMIWLPGLEGKVGSRRPAKAIELPLAASEVDVAAVRRKRSGQAIGLGLFAAFWNVFIFCFGHFGEWTWCLLPFALVGLFLILATIHSTLQIFNPAVGVSFARMPIHPGDSVRVDYSLVGNIFAVRQLTFTLEGREKVTYRQGTDTRSETHVAWRIECYETSNHVHMERGNFNLNLPADAMTTFIAGNNQFTWHLLIKGDIPGRPDIKDEIDVTVLPKVDARSGGH